MPSSKIANQYALITGASAGIGKAFAELLAARGYNLVLVARRREQLETLAAALQKQHGTTSEIIVADLADPNAPQNIVDTLNEKAIPIHFLINNAGYSLGVVFSQTDWLAHQDSLQVMIGSLTKLCHLIVPQMKARRYGRIINISSLAAFSPPMPGSLYTAIKTFVRDFSISLDMELKSSGIYCTAVCPGMTYSEFHAVMGIETTVEKFPKFMWMKPEQVAQQGFDAVMSGKPVIITGWINRVIALFSALTPNFILYKMNPSLLKSK